MDQIFIKRWHRFVMISVNLFMYLFILLAFYPMILKYFQLSLKQYIVSAVILLILGGLLCDRFLIKLILLKNDHIEIISKIHKIKIVISIGVFWSVIVGFAYIITNNVLISLYIATALALGCYYWFYFINYYLELMDSRKGKIFFKIRQ
ncbi:hypothetical protein PB1_02600 [Bacillus methanolicus PB1]|uniref:Uncharacterized protein n=1 Tax=Bacillus methanolicus PB1 TaxID=997296 RepID=I3E5M2_BACMT|nr:hypothetical protein PB1_02600 [Bacillus methanolicus PB1]